MKQWPKIGAYRNVVKHVRHQVTHQAKLNPPEDGQIKFPTLLFRGTVKLHGTNCGIERHQGNYTAQSRERTLSIDKDNYGFANWLAQSLLNPIFKHDIDNMFDRICNNSNAKITIFGEWVGKSIQNVVAISNLEQPHFVIFGAHIEHPISSIQDNIEDDFEDDQLSSTANFFVQNTAGITMPNVERVHNILEFASFFVSIDFAYPEQVVKTIEDLTLCVEQKCPVANQFGLDGIGEGIVWTCVEYPTNFSLMFKTKGNKHCGKSTTIKKVATISPEQLSKREELLDYIVSVERLTQGLQQVPITMKHVGEYINWVNRDILQEESDTIIASGFEWKQIVKDITERSKTYFINCIHDIP